MKTSRVFWLKLLQTFPQDNTNSHFQKQYVLFGYSLHTHLIHGCTNSQQVQKVMFFKKGTDYPMFPTSLLQYRSLSRYTPLNSLVSTCQVHFLNPSFFSLFLPPLMDVKMELHILEIC